MGEQLPLSPESTPNQVLGYVYDSLTQWLQQQGTLDIDPAARRSGEAGLWLIPPGAHEPQYRYVLPGKRLERLDPTTAKMLDVQSLELMYTEPHYAMRAGSSTPQLVGPRLLITDARHDGLFRDWEIYPSHNSGKGATWDLIYDASPELQTHRRTTLHGPGLVGLATLLASHNRASVEAAPRFSGLARVFRMFRRD